MSFASPDELVIAAADPKLAAALKLAKAAANDVPFLFAMVAKGPNDGALNVIKMKISLEGIADAKRKYRRHESP